MYRHKDVTIEHIQKMCSIREKNKELKQFIRKYNNELIRMDPEISYAIAYNNAKVISKNK
jgi:chromosome condensin MukBEF MukE localization factor